MPDTPPRLKLLDLAKSRFGPISSAEEKLFDAAADGKEADCTSLSEKDRVIQADRLSWLCTDRDASAQVTYRGVSILGAEIDGEVDLEWAKISFPLRANRCVFRNAIVLSSSQVAFLNLGGCSVKQLKANATQFGGNVLLRFGFKAEGLVDLTGATIGGNLECDGGQFVSEAFALNADGAKVEGLVLLRNGFKAEGGVNLRGARIGGNLECDGGQFVSKSEVLALNANGAKVEGSVFMRNGFKAEGGVNLSVATIGRNLACDGGQFVSKSEAFALNVDGAKVEGSVFMRNGFKAEGGANFSIATIGRNLECDGGQFVSKSKVLALNADGAKVATIGRNLECDGGQFVSERKVLALNADGAKVEGSVFMRNGFKAEGGVNLRGATIGGNLECDGGRFVSESEARALNADSAKIEGSVFFRNGTLAEGKVHFAGVYIGGSFQWSGVQSPEKSTLDLRFAKVGTLLNGQDSRPTRGKLYVDGLVYDQIDGRAFPKADVQLEWLHRQPQKPFSSQPYEQLAAVLRERGREEDAREVMIAKNKDHAAHLHWRPDWLWYGLFGKLIDYGYRPWRAFVISLIVIVVGWWLFNAGYKSKVITPPEEKAYIGEIGAKHQLSKLYPRFDALGYSVETFVPFLKLGVSQYWMPNATCHGALPLGTLVLPITGKFLRYYLWFHITAGWVLSVLWVGGITGLVKT